jgi:hypothetical protein
MANELTDEQFVELQSKYPAPQHALVRVKVQAGELVLRNPAEVEFHAFNASFWEKGGEPTAFRNALVQTCVYPDKATLIAWLARYPGLSNNARVTRAISFLAGMTDSLEGKGG